jgi:hypothetical protein
MNSSVTLIGHTETGKKGIEEIEYLLQYNPKLQTPTPN